MTPFASMSRARGPETRTRCGVRLVAHGGEVGEFGAQPLLERLRVDAFRACEPVARAPTR